jgi:H/ACA ribonucleoprotein complex subunit 1
LFISKPLLFLRVNPFVVVIGSFLQPCEADIVCKSLNEKIPFFNAPIYLENKVQIGKVDEIFGPINEVVSYARF